MVIRIPEVTGIEFFTLQSNSAGYTIFIVIPVAYELIKFRL
jgi:hypothetical protein